MDFALVAFGLGVGILVGMTGIGGGSLMTPMLILVFGVTPTTAIGTDLAYAAVTKTVGGYKHWKQRTVDLRAVHLDGHRLGAGGGLRRLRPDAAGGLARERLRGHCDRPARRRAPAHRHGHARARPAEADAGARARHDRDGAPPQDRRRGARRLGRLRARRDLGRERRADRRRADPAVPAHAAARGGHRRLPRRDPAVGGRALARGRRQRGLRPGGHDPDRLGARASGSAATGRCGSTRRCSG